MATLRKYLQMAQEVYTKKSAFKDLQKVNEGATPFELNGYNVQKYEWATWLGDGYQGAIYSATDNSEWVVAFSGTMGGGVAPVGQYTADARMMIHVLPNMAGSANAMVRWAKKHAGAGVPVTVVGHSLGGALAQVVGHWQECPFISLNGPGMRSLVATSTFNVFKPRQMVRSIAKARKHTEGYCYRIKGDKIAHLGMPLGLPRDYTCTSTAAKHGIMALYNAIPSGDLDANPFG